MKRSVVVVGLITVLIVLLFAVSAVAESGNYDGISWDLTDGVLTLGDGTTQTSTYRTNRDASVWPWHDMCSEILSIQINGNVTIVGSVNGMFHSCANLTTVDFDGLLISATTMDYMFYGCSNLTVLDLSNVNTSAVTSMWSTFENCGKLVSLDLSSFDTSNVTTMNSTFCGCKALTSLNVSSWNTSKVTNMYGMFRQCSNLESLDVSHFDTSHVISMIEMFSYCSKLSTLDVSTWDTSSVAYMREMFDHCSSLVTLDVSNFNTSSVTNMRSMFSSCSKLTAIDVSNFDMSHVTDIIYMFQNCSSVLELDVSNWNVQSITQLYRVFQNCSSLSKLDVSGWVTSQMWDMREVFDGCSGLTELDVTTWNTSNVTSMDGMFRKCSGLTELDVSNFDTHQVKAMSYLFSDCSGLSELDVTNFDTSAVQTMRCMFAGCSGLSEIDVSHFVTDNVANLNAMFYKCSGLTELDVTNFNTSAVTDMSSLFSNCTSLVSVDVSGFDTSAVTNMANMFSTCKVLAELDVSNFETPLVTNMSGMFEKCGALTIIDVSHFDTANVSIFTQMFYDATSVQSLDCSNFDTSKCSNMRYMFEGCKSLEICDVSSFDTHNVTNTDRMFQGCEKLKKLDLAGFDMSSNTNMGSMFYYTPNLEELILGEYNPFVGSGTEFTTLDTHTFERDGIRYTGKWIREDGTAGPYTVVGLRENYTSSMAGKWVWEKVPTEYSINFVCNEDGYLGEMPPVTVVAAADYELPGNAFRVFGFEFEYWTDGTRRTWEDKAIIPANTYAVGAEVTLTTVFVPRDRNINMQDGSFDFSIKGNEKALFQPIPASTSYQVYEQTPFGWNLIQQFNNVGEIMPDEESEALFLNKYDPLKVTIRFVGTKLMDESAADPDLFNFLLYEDETLIDIASVSEGGAIEFQPIEYDTAGDHHYYIKEVIGSDHTVEYDTHVEEIMVSITSDGVGHLSANVTMDDDQILFENKSKPGMLALRKLNATTEDHDGVFYYEVQFSSENGQPYDLLSSDISYEEREGNVSEFPETQPLPEKPKYTLTVQHYTLGEGLQPSSIPIKRTYLQCQAGNIATIEDAGIAYYKLGNVDSGAVQSANGKYQLLMPNHDLTVNAYYDRYQNFGTGVVWNGYDTSRPTVNIDVYGNGKYLGTAVNSGSSVYINVPVYDTSGNPMVYETEINGLPDDYYVRSIEKSYSYHRYFINTGFQAYAIWDDYDDYYGQRPSNVTCYMASDEGLHYTFSMSSDADYMYPFAYRDGTSHDATYWVDITAPSCPRNYAATTYLDDPIMDPHTIKFTLTSMGINGSIVWDDDDNSSGIRPSAITVYVMKDGNPVTSQLVRAGSTWSYSINGLELADNYTVSVDDIEGYTTSIDGTTITFTKIPTANIIISDVRLLSDEEYLGGRMYDYAPKASSTWWLKTPDSFWRNVHTVGSEGSVGSSGVDTPQGVRPALICDLSSTNLMLRDKISLAGLMWTVVSDTVILCDDVVGNVAYRVDYASDDRTDYEASDVKAWLDNWAAENGLMPEPGFEIMEVTLLSKDEYDTYRDGIAFDMAQWWWLRSPGSSSKYANFVRSDTGNVGNYAHSVSTDYFGVRPALICDLNDVGYSVGDKVSGSGYEWTVISNSISVTDDPYNGHGLILCDETVGQTAFRSDDTASDANVYDESDVKQWLANWVADHPFWTKIVTATVVQ